MRWLLLPADDRPAAREIVSRIDQILGYPRQHAEGELARHGRAPAGGWPAVRTETQVPVYVHDDTGVAQLHGAIAIGVDGVVEAIADSRNIDVGDGIRRRLRDTIAARGWVLRSDAQGMPGEPDAWTRVAHRDGAEGSADGRPIPEGEE